MRCVPTTVLILIALTLLPSCGGEGEASGEGGVTQEAVLDGLNNPACVTFSPGGKLTVCTAGPGKENGNGRVVVWSDGKTEDYVTGMATEYWKPGKDGEPDRFKLGPVGAVWVNDSLLAVSNGGLKDSKDNVLLFNGPGAASTGKASNGLDPTSEDSKDLGEGNLVGFSTAPGSDTVYVCGQGADAKSWLLQLDPSTAKLTTLASADDNGIATNSPMMSLPWGDDAVLVLYSGAGGKDDGLLVKWNVKTAKPVQQWTLPGLFDPMGMDRIPGSDDLVVVDNNWDLKSVKSGRVARVGLTADGGAAEISMIDADLKGPVSCAFGPDGRLYVATLGPAFDEGKGSVVAISGIK